VITHYAALLAQATPELNDDVTADDARSWQRYCQEAAHDLDFAAQATSVTDALQQRENQYAKDNKAPDGTKGNRGRSAAAHMLIRACQKLSRAKEAEPPRLSLS
jgi:hypothetical protein